MLDLHKSLYFRVPRESRERRRRRRRQKNNLFSFPLSYLLLLLSGLRHSQPCSATPPLLCKNCPIFQAKNTPKVDKGFLLLLFVVLLLSWGIAKCVGISEKRGHELCLQCNFCLFLSHGLVGCGKGKRKENFFFR